MIYHTPDQASQISEFNDERRAHEAFAESRRRIWIEQSELLEHLDRFIDADTGSRGLIVTGESGSGKSALLANWCAGYRRRNPDALVIEHYVGAASAASDHLDVIKHLVMAVVSDYRNEVASNVDADTMEDALPQWLSRIGNRKAIIVIDAVNQLDATAQKLEWLPAFIPRHVRIVASSALDATAEMLRVRGWDELTTTPLSSDDRSAIVRAYLAVHGTQLAPKYLDRIVAPGPSANPLFLCTGLSGIGSTLAAGRVTDRIEQFLGARDLDELFDVVLNRVELELGIELASSLVSALYSSRRGLSKNELALILDVHVTSIETSLRALDHHISLHGDNLQFGHELFRNAVARRYLSDQRSLVRSHAVLAEFFALMPLSHRRIAEEPWQWMKAGNAGRLTQCLTDREMFRALSVSGSRTDLLRYWRFLDGVEECAEAYCTAIAIWRKRPDEDMVADLVNVCDLLAKRGDYDAVESLCQDLLDAYAHTEEPRVTAKASHLLGVIAFHRGLLDNAEEFFRRSLEFESDVFKLDNHLRADLLTDLGTVLYSRARYDEAALMFDEALSISAAIGDDARRAGCLNNLAAVYSARGDLDRAADVLRRAIELNEERFGVDDPEVARNLSNLGSVECRLRNFESAAKACTRAVEILKASLGAAHLSTANAQINLAGALSEQMDHEHATPLLEEALVVLRKDASVSDIDRAEVIAKLGYARRRLNDTCAAHEAYAECVQLRLRALGPDHPQTIRAQKHLSECAQMITHVNEILR